jgi:hypothetical protein
LPEDPEAGKRSELQWREHLQHEEDERQTGFDRRRLKQHRALVKLIRSDRALYDRAQSAAAVEKVSARMPRELEEIRRRVTEIDHWGVNSRALADYAALSEALSSSYPAAKLAAASGDAPALTLARAEFDEHLENVERWLEQVEESEEDE